MIKVVNEGCLKIIDEEIRLLKKEIDGKLEYCSLSDVNVLEISQKLDILINLFNKNSIQGKEKILIS